MSNADDDHADRVLLGLLGGVLDDAAAAFPAVGDDARDPLDVLEFRKRLERLEERRDNRRAAGRLDLIDGLRRTPACRPSAIGMSAAMLSQAVKTRRPSGVSTGSALMRFLTAPLATAIRVLSSSLSFMLPDASSTSSTCRRGPTPGSATAVSQPPPALMNVLSARPTLPARSASSTVILFSPSGSGFDAAILPAGSLAVMLEHDGVIAPVDGRRGTTPRRRPSPRRRRRSR